MLGFGERLKTLRLEAGLSQPQLASALGVSNGIISIWENNVNEPKISYLLRICQIFHVSADYLLGLTDL